MLECVKKTTNPAKQSKEHSETSNKSSTSSIITFNSFHASTVYER